MDAEVAYTLADSLTFTLGAEDLSNALTEVNPGAAANVGYPYSQNSPFGFNGGLFCVRANLRLRLVAGVAAAELTQRPKPQLEPTEPFPQLQPLRRRT